MDPKPSVPVNPNIRVWAFRLCSKIDLDDWIEKIWKKVFLTAPPSIQPSSKLGFLSNYAHLNIFVYAGLGSSLILIFYGFNLFLIMVNRYRRKRPKVDASIFDSALSHTRRSDASEKREENRMSTFGHFRLWTSFESSPVSVKKKLSFIVPKTLPKTETVVSEDKSENDKNKGWTKYYRVIMSQRKVYPLSSG